MEDNKEEKLWWAWFEPLPIYANTKEEAWKKLEQELGDDNPASVDEIYMDER